MSKTFYFTLGPVQGFVAQARRTRDLWAGSYLLSYLSGVAMRELGDIEFPAVKDDPLFRAINGEKPSSKDDIAARIGSLPNRFKANSGDIPKAAARIEDEWRKIAARVKRKITSTGVKIDGYAREIWDRQVEKQWEIAWVQSEDGAALDRRKNLRTHFAAVEHGEKCTICGERQALCGNEEGSRKKVVEWWEDLAKKFNGERGLHFRPKGERLCAICTIKRVFPLITSATDTETASTLNWKVCGNYPSTAYIAAIDWLIVILSESKTNPDIKEKIEKFVKTAEKAGVSYDEEATRVNKIAELVGDEPLLKKFSSFSGDVFFPDSIRNKEDFPQDDDKLKGLIKELEALTKIANAIPSPFYALLLMDGDKMGEILSKFPTRQREISQALADFSKEAPRIVENECNGKLIYAGGDDVFALLPLDTALPCAKKLKDEYIKAFDKNASFVLEEKYGTISAGLVYAHMNTALQAVVKDAHALLDKIAKEERGRNAFAVRVWKRGGPVLTFGKKWKEADGAGAGKDWAERIGELKDDFAPRGDKSAREFSSGFFYRITELIPILDILSAEEQLLLLTAEYLKSRENLGLPEEHDEKLEKAKDRLRNLIEFSRWPGENGRIKPDGPLFIRFLCQKEV